MHKYKQVTLESPFVKNVFTLYLSMLSDYSQSFHVPMERVMNMKPIVCSQTSSKCIITSVHYIVSLLGVVQWYFQWELHTIYVC